MTRFLSNDNCECPKACEVHGGNNQVLNMMKKQKTKVDKKINVAARKKELFEPIDGYITDNQQTSYDYREIVDIKVLGGQLVLIFEGDQYYVIEAKRDWDGDVEFSMGGNLTYNEAKGLGLLDAVQEEVDAYEAFCAEALADHQQRNEKYQLKRLVDSHSPNKILEAMGLTPEQVADIKGTYLKEEDFDA